MVITGYSGAGKSEAIAAFEDGGYFCVDNLPPRMISSLGELFRHEGSGVRRAAIVSDVRGGEYFDELVEVLGQLTESGLDPTVLFLEADEATLLDRFKETRRRHPLAPDGRVLEGIRAEREVLGPLREAADVVMDTSDLTGAMLRRRVVTELLGPKAARGKLAATIITFGFKNGPPARGGPGARRPLPAQPALPRGSAAADRARPQGRRVRRGGRAGQRVLRAAVPDARLPACPPTSPRARRT